MGKSIRVSVSGRTVRWKIPPLYAPASTYLRKFAPVMGACATSTATSKLPTAVSKTTTTGGADCRKTDTMAAMLVMDIFPPGSGGRLRSSKHVPRRVIKFPPQFFPVRHARDVANRDFHPARDRPETDACRRRRGRLQCTPRLRPLR